MDNEKYLQLAAISDIMSSLKTINESLAKYIEELMSISETV